MLSITNIHASFENTEILKGISLTIGNNETHVIMGPNGSGKSTLAKVIAGHPSYRVTDGIISLDEKDIAEFEPEERAHLGIFLSFQQPREITGVNFRQYLHTIHRAKVLNQAGKTLQEARKDRSLRKEISPIHFRKIVDELTPHVNMPSEFLERNVNEGFSGGEKKKSEILQMEILQPRLALLDELDSGLDIDALRTVCKRIVELKEQTGMSILLITHYPKILEYLAPDKVHLFVDGQIVESGDKTLAERIEAEGYLTKK